jgi:hypothetical protein
MSISLLGQELSNHRSKWGPRYYSGDTMVAAEILAMRQRLAVNLLRTCKTINAEATAVFYGGNDFRFTMEDGWVLFTTS